MKFTGSILALFAATGVAGFHAPAPNAFQADTALFSTGGRLVKPGDVGSGPRVCKFESSSHN